MSVYSISDLHLSYAKPKPMDRFGAQWSDHEARVATNWRSVVGTNDLVLLPGDLSWAMRWDDFTADLSYLHSLPGTKIISRGNHDYYWMSKAKMDISLPKDVIALEQDTVAIAGFAIVGVKGWLTPGCRLYDSQEDEKYFLRERGRLERSLQMASEHDMPIIAMIHFPPFAQQADVGFTDLLEKYGVAHCVYGHLHGGDWQNQTGGLIRGVRYHLVSADYLEFRPKRISN